MSYILDALRRADSEREQGAVPSLHSKQVPPALADADEGEAARGVPLIGWIAMGGSALIGAALVWFFTGRNDAPAESPMPVAAAPVVMPAPAPAPVPAPSAQPEAAMAPAVPQPPAQAPVRTVAAPAPAPAVAPAPRVAESRAAARPTTVKPAAPAPAPADDTPVPSASDLPDDIRRQLPTLSVSGATYSKTASSRMLILNGQVFHEGDKVTNELTLEQIRLKSAVLSFRGTRYSISY